MSPCATAATKPIIAFNEAELANLLLHMWQDQYDLTQDLLPQNSRKLLVILENIDKVAASSSAKEKATKESQEGKSQEKLRTVPEVWGHAHDS